MAPTASRSAAPAALWVCGSLLMIAASVQGFSNVLLSKTPLQSREFLDAGNVRLELTEDCVLILRQLAKSVTFWTSGTFNKGLECTFELKENGDALLVSDAGKTIWRTDTGNKSGAYFIITCDGWLVLYTRRGTQVWNNTMAPSGAEMSENLARQFPVA